MTTDELIKGLREYAEAKEAWNSRDDFEQGCDTENLSRFSKAVMFMTDHASAIADELAMLAEEVKHLKPLVESTMAENAHLRAEVERMKEVGRYILDHYLEQCYDCDGIPDEAWAHTEAARALFPARDAGEVEGG